MKGKTAEQTLSPDRTRFAGGACRLPSLVVVKGFGPSLKVVACFNPLIGNPQISIRMTKHG